MPLLHWYCYSFLEQIFNCFANFATDFGNGNIMAEACPITKLNTSALINALTVLKTFCFQINLHQATTTAIMIMPGSVATYNVNPWNNTQASGLREDDKNSFVDGASCPTSNATFMPEQHNRGKRNPTTPDTNKENLSSRQRQKKPRRGEKVDTAAKEKKDLGMYYLRNLSINPADICPKDMPKKLCADFTCKGNECTNTNCDFAHPRKASELKRKTIILIASHFIKKDVGWFNKYHFMRMPNITEGVKKLLGNTKGPTSVGPVSTPKVVCSLRVAPVPFEQILSNKLHSTLVIGPTASKKVLTALLLSKLDIPTELLHQPSHTDASDVKSKIVTLHHTSDSVTASQDMSSKNSIIIQGTRERKRILTDYQENLTQSILSQL